MQILNFFKKNWVILLILFVAAILRFYRLGDIPPGLHPDEAANGLDIIRMIDNNDFRVSYDTNGPREALFFYLQGIFVYLGKITQWSWLYFTPLSLRIAPVLIGLATVWGCYLLARELFNEKVGLLSSLALAVSSWHVQFSRNGFRAIMVPLVLVFLFYYLIRAYRSSRFKDYALSGFWLGVGFYTYFAYRMVFIALFLLLLFILVKDKDFIKKNYKRFILLFITFILTALPMIIHFVYVPSDILGRASTSIFNPELNQGSAIKTFLDNKVKTLAMFNFKGDANWRHNVAGLPMLDIFSGLFLWIGLAVSLINIKKIEHFLLFAWFFALSLPELLTAEGIPHALRLVGIIPVVYVWVGEGLSWLLEKINHKKVFWVGFSLLLLVGTANTIWRYFIILPNSVEARSAYAEDMVELAKEIKMAPRKEKNILIVGEYGTKTVDFIKHSSVNTYERYELYDIQKIELSHNEKFNIYIQKDWISEADNQLKQLGYLFNFKPVTSQATGQILYYVFRGQSEDVK